MSMVDPAQFYKDYWVGAKQGRSLRGYYERLYGRILPRIQIQPSWKVLDVAGGNGALAQYLGVRTADLLDISDSGLEEASRVGFRPIRGNVEKRFPLKEESYDAALCFEVLEHLRFPGITLSEISHSLKPKGVLYVGQPNMRADGVHHVRRYYLRPLLEDLNKTGFRVEWIDYIPAYSMRDAIQNDIQKNPSWIRKAVQCVNWGFSFIPWNIRYQMARMVPDRFALIFVIKAVKDAP